MSLNVQNLDKLIAHLEAIAPSQISMASFAGDKISMHTCGTAGCIAGWALVLKNGFYDPAETTSMEFVEAGDFLGVGIGHRGELFAPPRYGCDEIYPAHRVIATLKRLRDRFLATGEIVVDWGAEPGSEPAQPWSAPQAVELSPPALPEEITRLLAPKPTSAAEEI